MLAALFTSGKLLWCKQYFLQSVHIWWTTVGICFSFQGFLDIGFKDKIGKVPVSDSQSQTDSSASHYICILLRKHLEIIRNTVKRQNDLLQECAAKIYCRIAVMLHLSVSIIGNTVYIPRSKINFWKSHVQTMYRSTWTYMFIIWSFFGCMYEVQDTQRHQPDLTSFLAFLKLLVF